MSLSARVTYPCGRCAQPVEVELHKSFVIDSEAALRTIIENRFHILDCAGCGERRPFEVDFLVTNQARDLFVQVITRDADVAAMADSMRSMLGEGRVHARIVASRNQLVDKVRLWSQRLDDVAIEVIKQFVRVQIKDLAGTTQSFFERIEGEDLVIATIGPGQPPLATTMPLEVYRNVVRTLDTAAHAHELEVDGRLARRLMDRKLPAPAPTNAAAAPAISPPPAPPQRDLAAPPSSSVAARVLTLAKRHGFLLSPLLLRALEARERDPGLAEWLALLGLDLRGPGSMIEDWDADPSLLELAQGGNGDAHCLYIYPPWCREGNEPVVVTFVHETNFVDFEALTFADYLERRLSDTHADASVVALVRERLSLPPRELAPVTPPAWLPLDAIWGRARAPKREEWLAMEQSGNVLAAERAALHCYLVESNESAGAREELRRMYAALGWSFALENLGAE